jgi:hypothetical protein
VITRPPGRAGGADRGMIMFQSAELRLAALAFSTGLAVWLASSPSRAFSQENLRSGGVGNPAFADPGDQVKNFRSGARPFGPNGPIVQFGAQRGPLNPFGRFQSNNYNPPPEPYARPLGNSD